MAEKKEDGEKLLQEGKKILQGRMYPNMDELPELNVSSVLANVEGLFRSEQSTKPGEKKTSKIYSTVGPVLIGLNPFQYLDCYGAEWAQTFRQEGAAGRIESAAAQYGPHCFCTIEQVFQGLSRNPKQAVIICGESGAGKTVTNKFMMEYLLKVDQMKDDGRRKSAMVGLTSKSTNKKEIQKEASFKGVSAQYLKRLAASNALLEAFGNAKTCRNDNSSRFGKLSTLSLQGQPLEVCGLAIEHYLLERVRVIDPPEGERNYHIMHQLAQKDAKGPDYFEYVKKVHHTLKADKTHYDDAFEHEDLIATMEEAGFSPEDIDKIFQLIEAVLYLGNIDFQPEKGGDSSSVKGGQSGEDMKTACGKLGVDSAKLSTALCQMFIETPEGKIERNVKVDGARRARDAVTKMLYSRIFDWIIRIMNNNLSRSKGKAQQTIGLLDIFGFEDMPINMFEQMFINLTNEQIQFLFNKIMIERELEVYKQEGIESSYKTPPSNQACLDLFMSDKPQGIIAAITERLRDPGQLSEKDGESLVNKFNQKFEKRQHYVKADPNVVGKVIKDKEKRWNKKLNVFYKECFQIQHYAGTVVYTIRDFLPKSVDNIEDHIFQVLQTSTEEKVRDLFEEESTTKDAGTRKKRLTVGEKFAQQLQTLSAELMSSNSIFVRCIKPTPQLLPNLFDPDLVLEQLRCGGVVAALEMRKAGLPDRMVYADFLDEFWVLEKGEYRNKQAKNEKVRVEAMLKQFHPTKADNPDWMLGNTRIFFRSGALMQLRRHVNFKRSFMACSIQRQYRTLCGKKLLFDIQQLLGKLTALKAEIADKGFASIDYIKKVVSQAENTLNASYAKVQAFQEKNKDLLAQDPKTGYYKINAVLTKDEMQSMKKSVTRAAEAVTQVAERRSQAEGVLEEQLANRKRQVDKLKARINEMAEICSGDSKDEVGTRAKCEAADKLIVKLLQEQLPTMMKKVLLDMDFSNDVVRETIRIPPEADKYFTDVEAAVKAAEDLGAALVQRRKEFQLQMLQANPEVKAALDKSEANKLELETLKKQIAAETDEVFNHSKEVCANALLLYDEMRAMWAAAAAPDKFVDCLKRFNASADAAKDAYESDQSSLASATSEKKAKYLEVVNSLERGEDIQKTALRLLKLCELAQLEMTGREGGSRASLVPVANDVRRKIGMTITAVEKMGFEAPEGEDVLMSGNMVADGEWSLEGFQRLGPTVDELKDKVQVLDKEAYKSVLAAVQALNTKKVQAAAGFCIGWSEALDSYYLLFQLDKQKDAYTAIGGSPSAFGKGSRMRDAVKKVIEKNDLQALVEAAKRQDEDLAVKIRQEIKGQIDALTRRCDATEQQLQVARKSELEQLEAKSKLNAELQASQKSLKALQNELKAKGAEGEKMQKQRADMEAKFVQLERNLKMGLDDANEIIEKQRLALRQAQRANMEHGMKDDLAAVTKTGERQIDDMKNDYVSDFEKMRADMLARFDEAKEKTLNTDPVYERCLGDCPTAKSLEAELAQCKSECTRLETEMLEMHQDVLKTKKALHEQAQAYDKELGGKIQAQVAEMQAQLAQVTVSMKDDLESQQKNLRATVGRSEGDQVAQLNNALQLERARYDKLNQGYEDLQNRLATAAQSSSAQPHLKQELGSILNHCKCLQDETESMARDTEQQRLASREAEIRKLQESAAQLMQGMQRSEERKQEVDQLLVSSGGLSDDAKMLQVEVQLQLRNELQEEREKCELLRRQLREAENAGFAVTVPLPAALAEPAFYGGGGEGGGVSGAAFAAAQQELQVARQAAVQQAQVAQEQIQNSQRAVQAAQQQMQSAQLELQQERDRCAAELSDMRQELEKAHRAAAAAEEASKASAQSAAEADRARHQEAPVEMLAAHELVELPAVNAPVTAAVIDALGDVNRLKGEVSTERIRNEDLNSELLQAKDDLVRARSAAVEADQRAAAASEEADRQRGLAASATAAANSAQAQAQAAQAQAAQAQVQAQTALAMAPAGACGPCGGGGAGFAGGCGGGAGAPGIGGMFADILAEAAKLQLGGGFRGSGGGSAPPPQQHSVLHNGQPLSLQAYSSARLPQQATMWDKIQDTLQQQVDLWCVPSSSTEHFRNGGYNVPGGNMPGPGMPAAMPGATTQGANGYYTGGGGGAPPSSPYGRS